MDRCCVFPCRSRKFKRNNQLFLLLTLVAFSLFTDEVHDDDRGQEDEEGSPQAEEEGGGDQRGCAAFGFDYGAMAQGRDAGSPEHGIARSAADGTGSRGEPTPDVTAAVVAAAASTQPQAAPYLPRFAVPDHLRAALPLTERQHKVFQNKATLPFVPLCMSPRLTQHTARI